MIDKFEKGYRKLIAWQKANDLAFNIYEITSKFKNNFSLVSQMERAALSVPANIVEGYSRSSNREKRRFYQISISSLTELEYYIDFAYQLKHFDDKTFKILIDKQSETARILTGLIKSTKY